MSAEMVLPGLGGQWLDDRLGSRPLLTFLGFAFGLTAGVWHLTVMTRSLPTGGRGKTHRTDDKAHRPIDDDRIDTGMR